MKSQGMLYLNRAEVASLLPMTEAVAVMRDAFLQLSAGEARVPVRGNLAQEPAGEFLTMPVHLPRAGYTGVKCVSISPGNPAAGLPLIHAMVLVFDAGTGQPLALMDGEHLTALRTGAASGLATDMLADPSARVLGLVGAGKQAIFQAEAVKAVRSIEKVLVLGRDPDRTAQFCRTLQERLGCEVEVAENAMRLREATVICTATTSSEPVLTWNNVSPGVHLNAIGAYRADMRELSSDLIERAHVFVDQREACLAEAGDLLIPIKERRIDAEHIVAELGELVAGGFNLDSERSSLTVFKSVGNAVQDLAAASRVLENALAQGVGTHLLP